MADSAINLYWTIDYNRLEDIPDYKDQVIKRLEELQIKKEDVTVTDVENAVLYLFPHLIELYPDTGES